MRLKHPEAATGITFLQCVHSQVPLMLPPQMAGPDSYRVSMLSHSSDRFMSSVIAVEHTQRNATAILGSHSSISTITTLITAWINKPAPMHSLQSARSFPSTSRVSLLRNRLCRRSASSQSDILAGLRLESVESGRVSTTSSACSWDSRYTRRCYSSSEASKATPSGLGCGGGCEGKALVPVSHSWAVRCRQWARTRTCKGIVSWDIRTVNDGCNSKQGITRLYLPHEQVESIHP